MRQSLFKILGPLTLLALLTFTTYAVEQFDTDYNTTYEVLADGITKVTQEIVITNRLPDVLATNYTLTIRQMDVYDITGFDKEGPLKLDIKKDAAAQNETVIKTNLNQQVLGEGRKNKFSISYKSKDITNKVGEVWNTYIPQISGLDNINSYNTYLKVPLGLGPKIFISPTPKSEVTQKDITTYDFDKELLKNTGVNASFGKYQLLNFRLKYQLKNQSILPTYQKIALPPEIKGKQQIDYKSLSPNPQKVELDKDGNTIATYYLWPRQELNVELLGSAKVLGKQIKPENSGKFFDIPNELINAYTKPDIFWESDSAEIKKLANDTFDKDKTVAQNAHSIYKYITQNLEYNFNVISQDFVERKGALTALTKKGQYACMEFTDLFIATARSMGIPAREINGYAFTTDKTNTPVSVNLKTGDLLHAWPEFYDPQFGWVSIDPTWGNTSGLDYFTKLDTNHFAFVVKGISSQTPLPAGSYRANDKITDKQVEVDFAQDLNSKGFEYNFETKPVADLNLIMFLRGFRAFEVKNTGSNIIYDLMGETRMLLPSQNTKVYVNTKNPILWFVDFSGEKIERRI